MILDTGYWMLDRSIACGATPQITQIDTDSIAPSQGCPQITQMNADPIAEAQGHHPTYPSSITQTAMIVGAAILAALQFPTRRERPSTKSDDLQSTTRPLAMECHASAFELETRRSQRSTKDPRRMTFDFHRNNLRKGSRPRSIGVRVNTAMLCGSLVVLGVLCVSTWCLDGREERRTRGPARVQGNLRDLWFAMG